MDQFEAAANLALFLQEKTGSVHGIWSGRMTAKEQRDLFGLFVGKGRLEINGANETVGHTIKVAFGFDWETLTYHWRDLGTGGVRKNR